MSGAADEEVLFTKKKTNAATPAAAPSAAAKPAAAKSPTAPTKTPTASAKQQAAEAAAAAASPAAAPPAAASSSTRGARRGSVKSPTAPVPPQLLDIQVSCRNLSSNSSVVALFEAKGNRSLEYVGHSEGIRHSHHPDFQTHLIIEHRKGTNQKVKFNVYTLPPVHTRVEEKMRIGSAYVYLDEIASNTGLDLLIDLVHGYNSEKDKNNAWLKSHLLIKARIKEDRPEEERLAKVRATSLDTMKAGRVMTLYDVQHKSPPKEYLFFFRPDSELGALHWLDLSQCPGKKVPPGFDPERAADEGGDLIRLMDILAIYEGHQTQAYTHPVTPAWSSTAPDRCFSIILADGSIDLQCATVDDREAFMLGIHDILTTQAQKERDLENTFKFLVKCRNLPPEVTSGGLFIALSSRDSKGLQYEVVGKTGWLPASQTPDFPKAMAVPHVSETQSLKFDLFHDSLQASDGVGTAIVVYKELREHIGQMVMIPLRNMVDPEMDALLQKYKSVMLIECLEHGDDPDDEDEIAEEGDSDDESEEYYGQKLRKLREKNQALMAAGASPHVTGGGALGPISFDFPPMPMAPPPPKPSAHLFSGYLLDKYAFNTKGCQRKLIFAAKDVGLTDTLAEPTPTTPQKPSLTINTLNSPGPQGHPSPSPTPAASPAAVVDPQRQPERMRLYWCKPGRPVKNLESSLRLSEITNLTIGKRTPVLQRKDAAKAEVDCCLSLYWGQRTLDLVADTQEVRDAFVYDLVCFLLPRSKAFEAYGACGTGQEEAYEKAVAEHKATVKRMEEDIRARLAAGGGGGSSNNPYAELAGSGDNVNQTTMPDLQAAMGLLAKLHDRGMERLGLAAGEEYTPSKHKKGVPTDIMSSLAALDDMFSEIDARFANGGSGSLGGGGSGSGDGTGSGDGGGKGKGRGGKGRGGGHGDGVGSGSDSEGEGGGGGHGRGRGGKGKGGGKGDGTGSGSDEDGLGGGGGRGKGRGGKGKGGGKGDGKGDGSGSDGEGGGGGQGKKKDDPKKKKDEEEKKSDDDAGSDDEAMNSIKARLEAAKKDAGGDAASSTVVGTDGVPMAPGMSGFVSGNAPPPPPMGPGMMFNAPVARKMKQLHWDPLNAPEVSNTIFFNLSGQTDALEEEGELDELFANHIQKKIEQRAKGAKGIALIDAKRAYNVEIGTSRLKMTNAEIHAALLALDPAVLTEEKAQILYDRVPSLEELTVLKKFTGNNADLGSVEQFFLMMATVPMCGLRLECHLFRLRFPELAADLKTKLKVMFNACKALTTSNNLARVYQLVLQVGNYLNAGTRKGNAAGFKLASLPALSNTKSTDGKLTLLDYIVTRVDKQFKSPEDRAAKVPFLLDIHVLKDAVNYDWANVMEDHRKMKGQLKKIQTIITGDRPEDAPGGGRDHFHSAMTSFYAVANEEFKLLTKRLKRIIQLEEQLLAFFGESKEKTNLSLLFSMLNVFTSQFEFSEGNLKTYAAVAPKKKTVQLAGEKLDGMEGGVIDPRLGGNFSSMLQGVKLKSRAANAKHLASGYSGRKAVTLTPIAPSNSDQVSAEGISIDFGEQTEAGEQMSGGAKFVAPPEFVTSSSDTIPMAPPPETTLFP